MTKDTDGSDEKWLALPVHEASLDMTIRDYFATHAMIGYLSNPEMVRRQNLTEMTAEALSKIAYGIADAMLAERDK